MSANNFELKVFSGTSNPKLAQGIAKELGTKLGEVKIKQFSDGEKYLRFEENIRGRDVFLIQSTSTPVNDNLMELLIMIDAARRASAGRIIAVIPYYGYARQDRKAASREPITAKLVAELLEKAGVDRVVTVDLHSDQIQGFFDVPLDNLTGIGLLIDCMKGKKLGDVAIVAPDAGAAKKNTKIAKAMNANLVFINKARAKHNEADALNVIGDVKGKNCIIFDDMIDTAGTMCVGAELIRKVGAKKIYAASTHGILSGHALERIAKAPFEEVVVTDTIPQEGRKGKIRTVSIAKILAQSIKSIHENESVSSLFEYDL